MIVIREANTMQIGDLIQQIAALWQPYRQKITVDKGDPVYKLVVKEFPDALLPYVATPANTSLEGSTGAGNITAAPWIALFDNRVTTSATTGYYVVYLFSTDMSGRDA
jgi:5-methylcytosine-specific restriction enzyme MrcB-like protein